MYRWVRQHYQFQLRGVVFWRLLVGRTGVALQCRRCDAAGQSSLDGGVLPAGAQHRHRFGGAWSRQSDRLDVSQGLTLQTFVNDGLMVVFFFLIGLEIKREIVIGQALFRQKAILPVLAALGGMVVPALIYFSFNAGTVAAPGWGIPTATDIAFAIGILSIFSDRVPISLKIFLTALAVADDLGRFW